MWISLKNIMATELSTENLVTTSYCFNCDTCTPYLHIRTYTYTVYIYIYVLFHALLWNMASYFTSDVAVFSRAEGE